MTDEPKAPETLLEALDQWLYAIDSSLITEEVPVADRPFIALVRFVEDAVMDIRGGPNNSYSKESYVRQRWFHHLHREVIKWYRERYGAKARPAPKGDVSGGLLQMLGAAFKLQIPLDRSWPDGTGKMWFEMAGEVRPGEDPFAWIQDPPNLEFLTPAEKGWLRKSAAQVVRLTRSLRVDLMSVHPRTDEFNGFSRAIRPCLDRAVDAIVEANPSGLCMAMWDLHFAVEVALKAFIAQRGLPVQHTHELPSLYADALKAGLARMPARLIRALPRAADSIDYRYGQGPPPSLSEAYCRYRVALLVTRHCTRHLSRRLVFGKNPAFLLQSLVAGSEDDSQPGS